MNFIPYAYASSNNIAVVTDGHGAVSFTAETPNHAISEVTRKLVTDGYSVEHIVFQELTDEELSPLIERLYSEKSQALSGFNADEEGDLEHLATEIVETTDLLGSDDEAPVVRIVNKLIAEAIKERASDIHVQPHDGEMWVRMRIDGVLETKLAMSIKYMPLIVSRIKVMSQLDVTEKRIPQDGRISTKFGGRDVNLRVSTLPADEGERVVIRVLDNNMAMVDIGDLGFASDVQDSIRKIIKKPHGIFLVTGPTGSGKSTTLYAALSEVDVKKFNTMTIEDPKEFEIQGVSQTQVNEKTGLTFAVALRAILRQDPDVAMVGEIRDSETANIAIEGSLTGHLVLSSLHTNTAVGAIARLKDIGVDPFLISTSLMGVLSQRLVRTLCPSCKVAHKADATELSVLGVNEATLYSACGCKECRGTGYKGRTVVYEYLEVNDAVRKAIHSGASESEIILSAPKSYQPISISGKEKVLSGDTSLEEVIRVLGGFS